MSRDKSRIKMALQNIKNRLINCEDFVIRMGQIFCIIPWYEKDTYQLCQPILNKIFALVYLSSTVSGMYWFLCRFDHFYCFNHFECILSFLGEIISICFTVQVITLSNFVKLKKWKKLLKLIAQMNLPKLKTKPSYIIWGHIGFISTRLYYHWFKMKYVDLFTILFIFYEIIHNYQYFLSTFIICHYVILTQRGFEQALDDLRKCSKSEITDMELEEKIRCVGKNCRYLFKIGENTNAIFGWTVLLIFSNGIVQVLRTTNFMLFLFQGSQLTMSHVIFFFCKTLLCFAETIYIIIICESSSQASEKIRLFCYKLQENVHIKSSAREEFFKLATVVITFSPKLTAANFFIINRGTLLGIVNLSTTYLLIILQFYIRDDMDGRQ